MKDIVNSLHNRFSEYGGNAREWTRKCALLLPEIEKYEVWKKKGFGSIYEYAAKLAGMSRNAVDDALRILRKIEDKPALMKVAEKKGINAVRPVVAVATVENADFWAGKAEIMSKHTLETYIREVQKLRQEGLFETNIKHYVVDGESITGSNMKIRTGTGIENTNLFSGESSFEGLCNIIGQ